MMNEVMIQISAFNFGWLCFAFGSSLGMLLGHILG